MNTDDKKEFHSIMVGIFLASGRDVPEKQAVEVWWGCFVEDPMEDVRRAFGQAIRESTEFLNPGSVRKYMPDRSGHPNPEEAWNVAQKDEYTEGAYMTQEMLGAICAANDSIERGDLIGARRCFIDVYTQKVQESKRERRPASFSYFAPIGLVRAKKQQIQEAATRDAEVKGWITHEQAQGVLVMLDRPVSDEMKRITDKSADRTKLLQ